MAKKKKQVESLTHEQASRKNIPTAELQSLAENIEDIDPAQPAVYMRNKPLAEGETRPRNEDADPQMLWRGTRIKLTDEMIERVKQNGGFLDLDEAQLVWRGKDQQDWSDLVVNTPPLYIQEKIHPKAIIDDLTRQTKEAEQEGAEIPDLFADFNGIDVEAKTEFYAHDQHWSNRMILGDSLQVMASLAEREAMRGKVQCIYFDPPYGIKFNSNWQVSTRSRDVKDGKIEQLTREPEQVKAFRDTWRDGIHSYLTYLRDRLTVMRDMLTESGSIFVQIGDENVHRVRVLMDEVFGEGNFVTCISYASSVGLGSSMLDTVTNYILWYSKDRSLAKYRPVYKPLIRGQAGATRYNNITDNTYSDRPLTPEEKLGTQEVNDNRCYFKQGLTSRSGGESTNFKVNFYGRSFIPTAGGWRTGERGMKRVVRAARVAIEGKRLTYKKYFGDFGQISLSNFWTDLTGGVSSRTDPKVYVVQTSASIIERCILMTTDPGDLVLDPTCGSGTTATAAEQWGRRWITIDTSRVALALARSRLMAARYPYYMLADSEEGRKKEQEVSGKIQPDRTNRNDIRQGFVYERVPHITLKSIANNEEIDIIWEKFQTKLEPLREQLNAALGNSWEEWEIPREVDESWSDSAKLTHKDWWEQRIARQNEIDTSIAQRADVEFLYDRPYEDKSRVRVAGPFTFESLSPHRVVPADEEEMLGIDSAYDEKGYRVNPPHYDFAQMVFEHLKTSGVHQATKEDRVTFHDINGWPGKYICGVGHVTEGKVEKRAAIYIGPEFGTVSKNDLRKAVIEAQNDRFDMLIACGFNFDAHTTDVETSGSLTVLKAKMNPELHMSDELKNTGAGNMFIVFGEPDIEWKWTEDGKIEVEIHGIDVFDPKKGEVRASGKDDIAAWFIDTDYNEESFFVRHAYFLGANDPYKSLKTALKAEIDKEAWETLYRDKSRPFDRPQSGKFAIKVINHFGDEVMKVYKI